MAWKKSLLSLTALSLGMSLELAIMAIGSAQAGVSNSISQRTWQVSQFNPPDRGAPTRGVAGATRGGPLCGVITPLSPTDFSQDSDQNPPYFGLTVSAKPIFLWHIKNTNNYAGDPVYFELKELGGRGEADQVIYSKEFNLPTTPGVISLNLPDEVNLEEGKKYYWYMEMECADPEPGAIEVVGIYGWVERVAETPTLKNNLAMVTTPADRSEAYGEAGIWFDALNVLAQERMKSDTPDLEANWKALLQAIQLNEDVFNAELIDCCSVESAGDASGLTTHN